MRTHIVHRRLAQAAVVAASAALLAACGQSPPTSAPTPGGTEPQGDTIAFTAGVALISDGTRTVRVGDQKVAFPTAVTDAVFSLDGSRLAFIDGDGNVATARPDGKSLKVLTTKAAGVVRSRPTWMGRDIVFAERSGSGPTVMKTVNSMVAGATGEREVGLGLQSSTGDPSGLTTQQASIVGVGDEAQIAFQRSGPKGAEVWIVDLNQRFTMPSKLAAGSEPALSPDAARVAFVDPTGQIEVIDRRIGNGKAVQVSFGATSPTHLTWTADGRIAYSTPTGVESIAATVAAGATSNPAVIVSSAPGTATFLPTARDRVGRITGTDPVEVAIAASRAAWPDYGTVELPRQGIVGPDMVVLTGTASLSIVLAGSQVINEGPVLFTTGSTLDSRTAAELKRVLGPADTSRPVTILGGPDVVPVQVEAAVRAMGYRTVRTAGADPIAMAVAAAGNPQYHRDFFLVDAADTAAYLAVVGDARFYGAAVLLTNGSTMPDAVKTYLAGVNASSATVYPVDQAAQAALATSWPGKPVLKVIPPTGDESVALLQLNQSAGGMVVVDRSNLADVMTAIGLAQRSGAVLLAIDPNAGPGDAVKAWLDGASASIDQTFIVDSQGVIGADLERTLSGLAAGPLGAATVTNPKAIA